MLSHSLAKDLAVFQSGENQRSTKTAGDPSFAVFYPGQTQQFTIK